ncbi:MAG: hypothetical protein ACD_49C00060G0040 [uncultured bacterium (gcode 4)]|uniref:Uncharacterized protein n=1 Tax=uncultured bacterium (gcode 4) TaxID=1234023 RepID=K2BBR4_9BACT|nr:MAG: hypothetical protein ACD_49C00060G0040 [uncultured bacterium (gcode 4)]
MKNILYIKWSWLWDIISSIPKLTQLRLEKNKIYWLYTGNFNQMYINYLNILKDKWLIDEIIITSFDFNGFLFILMKYFKKFDLVVIWWVSTLKTIFLSFLLWKKREYNLNSINWKDDMIKSELWISWKPFYLWNIFDFKKLNNKYRYIWNNFIVLYWSFINRSMNSQEWLNLWHYLTEKWYDIVLIWWDREKWLKDIYDNENIKYFDLIWNLDFYDLVNILSNSKFNICGNWWIMWIANLVNKKNINFHTVSRFIWEAPVDNIDSFNLRLYHYKNCKPCESWNCKFKWTKRELECLNSINAKDIINLIDRYYLCVY